jgi:hypothetical protein
MAAEEACARDDEVAGYGQLGAEPVLAAQTRDERAGEKERCSVRAEGVDRADPAFNA